MRRGRSQAGQGRFFLETCSEKRSRISSEDCRRTFTANEGQDTTRGTVLAMSLFCPNRLAVSWLQGSSEQSDSCWHSEERPQSQAWPITPAVQRTGSASNAQKAKKIPVVCLRAICSSLVTRQTTVNNIIIGTLSPPLDIRPTQLRAASVSREPQTIGGKGDASLKSEQRQNEELPGDVPTTGSTLTAPVSVQSRDSQRAECLFRALLPMYIGIRKRTPTQEP